MLVEGIASPSVPVVSGVPQGTVLSPLLFLLTINDLSEKVSSTVRLFADDNLLYRKIKSQEDHDILQEDLHLLEGCESDWQMLFNPSKSGLSISEIWGRHSAPFPKPKSRVEPGRIGHLHTHSIRQSVADLMTVGGQDQVANNYYTLKQGTLLFATVHKLTG